MITTTYSQIDRQARNEAITRLRTPIQSLLDQTDDPDIAYTVLGEAFFISLRTAGAEEWQIAMWTQRTYGALGMKSNFGVVVQAAYKPLGEAISNIIAGGIPPLAVASALMTAILEIVEQVLGSQDAQYRWLVECLHAHLDDTAQSQRENRVN